ncbi:MAG: hypothetical protein FWD66_10545 [Paludibacter sp.]|nr:hypothetical protein [Paludibacter sp.]
MCSGVPFSAVPLITLPLCTKMFFAAFGSVFCGQAALPPKMTFFVVFGSLLGVCSQFVACFLSVFRSNFACFRRAFS